MLVKDRQEEKEVQQEETAEDQTYKPMEDDQEDGHVQVRISKTNNVEKEEEAKIQGVTKVLEISRAKINIDEHYQCKCDKVVELMQQMNRYGIPPNKEDIEDIKVFEESPSFVPLSNTDSQTEIVNKCLEGYLQIYTSDKQGKWMRWLHLVEYWCPTAKDTLQEIQDIIKILKDNLSTIRNRMKQMTNKKRVEQIFIKGDMVFV